MLKLRNILNHNSDVYRHTGLIGQQLRLFASKNDNEESYTDFEQEWKNAKPFEAIPHQSRISLLRNFLPGGKYASIDATELMFVIKPEKSEITLLRGMFGRKTLVVTYNPKDFEKVLRNEGVWPQRPGLDVLGYYRSVLKKDFYQGTEGLLPTCGEKWAKFRSVVNPVLMQPKNVRLYMHQMSNVNKQFIERIRALRDPQTLEVPSTFEDDINHWTLESVSIVALDKQLGLLSGNHNDPTVKKLILALKDFFIYTFEVDVKQPSLWKYNISTAAFKKLVKALDTIHDIITNYVQETIDRLEAEQRSGVAEKPESEQSVLEKLIKIDKKIAKVMAIDMLFAGVDTTTTTFTGLLLCLAKNPGKQAKLREEIMRLLPDKDSDFNEDAFRNMPYLRACIKESQRLYPLAVGHVRVNPKDLVLSGHRIPAGHQILLVSVMLNTNETYYRKANEFLPERWLRQEHNDENIQNLKLNNPFVFLPFGFGPRSCVGRRFAELEIELGIARLIRNFYVEFNYSTKNAFKSLSLNVPNIPLKFKFTDVK